MRAAVRRWAAAPVLGALLTVQACGAGGFGGNAPEAEVTTKLTTYVALGDGFAAGPFLGITDRTNGCLRSSDNYPHQVAQRLGVQVTDVSCVGATTTAVSEAGRAPVGRATLPAQLDAVTPDADLVTLTVGINDDQLLQRGFFVCMELPCTDRIPALTLVDEADAAGDRAEDIIRAIQKKAPQARIVVVGYPELVPQTKPCRGMPTLDSKQLLGVSALFTTVNRGLQSAAFATGTDYVDLARITAGHHVCGADPWVRGFGSKPSPRTVLHPLAPAQRAAADAIVETTRTGR